MALRCPGVLAFCSIALLLLTSEFLELSEGLLVRGLRWFSLGL